MGETDGEGEEPRVSGDDGEDAAFSGITVDAVKLEGAVGADILDALVVYRGGPTIERDKQLGF